MAEDFLSKIVKEKQAIVKEKKIDVSLEELKEKSKEARVKRSFKQAINKPDKISLIAEVKQASPSKGIIRKDFDSVDIALTYQNSGADALSVLTEGKYFKGSLSDIENIREKSNLPILRKDFIVDVYQIYESHAVGADAILLIAEILSGAQINEFLDLSENLGLDCLVEASSELELQKVIRTKAKIIGINNRNLRTFKVDTNISEKLVPLISEDKIIVAESGIKDSETIKSFKSLGVNAVLIGEALLVADDIGSKVKELTQCQ